MASQGKPRGVYVVTDADLEGAVGGTFIVQPGPAIRADGYAQGDRGVTGGKPIVIYVVDATEAARRGVMGGQSVPIVDMTSSGRNQKGPHIAIPVYMVSGADNIGGGGVTPVPPTPPTPPEPTVELIEIFSGDDNFVTQGNQEQGLDEYWGTIIV